MMDADGLRHKTGLNTHNLNVSKTIRAIHALERDRTMPMETE